MESRPSVQLITEELIDAVVAQARQSTRRRKNYNFHAGDEDNPHRFLNAILHGSYVRPHRHLTPPKAESFLVLRGHAVAFVFDDNGAVISGHILGPGAFSGQTPSHVTDETVARGIDLRPGPWHCVAALTAVAVCYEVKPGPWDPAMDKEFAPWAPEEGSAGADRYLAALLL
jgi:cupin fold WbuC family metalloprotein